MSTAMPRAREIQRHDGVLAQAAALHEQDACKLAGTARSARKSASVLLVDGDELLAAVAHLHHAHAAAVPVQHLGGGLAGGLLRAMAAGPAEKL
jgi:hypothetical protein